MRRVTAWPYPLGDTAVVREVLAYADHELASEGGRELLKGLEDRPTLENSAKWPTRTTFEGPWLAGTALPPTGDMHVMQTMSGSGDVRRRY